jgi:sulfite oxidase
MNVVGGMDTWHKMEWKQTEREGDKMKEVKRSLKHTALDLHPEMLVRQEHPLNVGAPLELNRHTFVTPQDCFFVRNHGVVPRVNMHHFRLSVSGRVQVYLELSMDELRTHFPPSTLMATLQCAGHRRDELAVLKPIPGEIPWGAETIGNAVWRGVALREVLLVAGVEPEVRHVAFLGLDAIHTDRERIAFGGSIPIEKAMSSEVLLAYEMNGHPLSPRHGFPLRVLVPGYIGARSVKWLAGIVLQEEPSANYYQARAYKLFPPHIQAESADWTHGQMLGALPLNSVIFRPCEGELLKAGPISIQGYALAREDHSIERVELSSDGGATWADATLLEQPQPWTWCFWEITLPLDSGPCQLIVRAWDSAGGTQPADVRQVWNWKGYVNNAWHRVNVVVHQASTPESNSSEPTTRHT